VDLPNLLQFGRASTGCHRAGSKPESESGIWVQLFDIFHVHSEPDFGLHKKEISCWPGGPRNPIMLLRPAAGGNPQTPRLRPESSLVAHIEKVHGRARAPSRQTRRVAANEAWSRPVIGAVSAVRGRLRCLGPGEILRGRLRFS
jgi:hypothetical protein